MNTDQINIMDQGLRHLGLIAEDRHRDLLIRYIEEIELWNDRLGLLAPGEDLVRRHILDSLTALKVLRESEPRRAADIGSGAGFPGIPLAIYMENCRFSLVERMGRRAGFLRNAALVLGLENLDVLDRPVQELSPADGLYDLLTFRAWSALDPEVLSVMARILAPDGVVAAYKGRRDVIDQELRSVAGIAVNPEVFQLETFSGEEERNLVLFGLSGTLGHQ